VLRAFNTKTGKVLWTFQTGFQIADGPSIYSIGGKEYVAIGVGGTPTSSSGGTVASQVQVFALGGSSAQSAPPKIQIATAAAAPAQQPEVAAVGSPALRTAAVRRTATATVGSPVRIVASGPVFIRPWNANTSNIQDVQARVLYAGKPLAGVRVSIDGWVAPRATDAGGTFTYPADVTTPQRHVARVVDASHATIGGHAASAAQKAAVARASGGISVGYRFSGLRAHKGAGGTIVVDGKVTYGGNASPPPVLLYTYLLKGTVTDADGKPVKGAIVTTRTNDRQYWTQSRPTGANGQYASFLVAADTLGDKPVPMNVGVAVGDQSYAQPFGAAVNFAYLKSSVMNIKLPASASTPLSNITVDTLPGAIYQGMVVGVVGNGRTIRPVSARWPTSSGSFQLVLPPAAAGLNVAFWQSARQFYSTSLAKPGGPIDLGVYPTSLPAAAPQALARLQLPG
jgi:hypothetical protein